MLRMPTVLSHSELFVVIWATLLSAILGLLLSFQNVENSCPPQILEILVLNWHASIYQIYLVLFLLWLFSVIFLILNSSSTRGFSISIWALIFAFSKSSYVGFISCISSPSQDSFFCHLKDSFLCHLNNFLCDSKDNFLCQLNDNFLCDSKDNFLCHLNDNFLCHLSYYPVSVLPIVGMHRFSLISGVSLPLAF